MSSFEIFTGIFGGLGLFLYGMKLMSDGLENAAGERLKGILEKVTTNRFVAVLVGAIVTSIIQSSSATTVMVVSFVNAGLMSLVQAVGVIMGANIGTTITAQMVSFKLDTVAPIFIGIGAILTLIAKKKRVKDISCIALGFGILFLGMGTMSAAMKPVAEMPAFSEFILVVGNNAILGLLTGLIMTAIVQSSSATTGILVALAATGTIDMKLAFPVILGCNIGTCVTALLASVGANRVAKKAALMHLFFNIFGAIIFFPFISQVKDLVEYISPDNVARQVANAHTIFNVIVTIVIFPLAGYLVKLVNLILPGGLSEERNGAIYLDKQFLDTPIIASGQIIKETIRMAEFARDNFVLAMRAFLEGNQECIDKVYSNEEIINTIEKEITDYLIELSQHNLPEADSILISETYHTINDIERIGDHATNIVELASDKIAKKLEVSNEALSEIEEIYNTTLESLNLSITSYSNNELIQLKDIECIEEQIDTLEKKFRANNINRLNAKKCTASSGVIFFDLLSNLERIGDHANNIARAREKVLK
ncbi:Na/Pi cotransporter family protein [Clostridium saudiense]|nr:Na/Pi cotransporter family protein [Clostridium saudiense]